MKMLAPLSSLPEMSGLNDAERAQVISAWRSNAVEPWSGYLLCAGFTILVALLIVWTPLLLFSRLFSSTLADWVLPASVGPGVILANILYSRLILRRRRDLLHRVIEERRNASNQAMEPTPPKLRISSFIAFFLARASKPFSRRRGSSCSR